MTPTKRIPKARTVASPPSELLTLFRCDGDPVYGDVTDGRAGPWFSSHDLANAWGRRVLDAGNWFSFGVIKRTFRADNAPTVYTELPDVRW